jgi:hypothetical protein
METRGGINMYLPYTYITVYMALCGGVVRRKKYN